MNSENSSGMSQYEQIVCKQLNEIFSRNVGKFDEMMSLTIKRRLNDADVIKAIDTVIEDKLRGEITNALTRTMSEMEADNVYRNIMSENIHKIFNEDIKKILLASISSASDDVRRQVCNGVANKISNDIKNEDIDNNIIDVESSAPENTTGGRKLMSRKRRISRSNKSIKSKKQIYHRNKRVTKSIKK